MDTPEHYRALLERFDDYDIPSAEECKVILIEKCSVARRVLVHSCKVAEVAQRLCHQLKARGCVLDERLVLAAALLHDLAKGRPDHAATAAGILTRLGYARVAELVEGHMGIGVAEDDLVNELDIIRLADRIVEEDRVVHLEHKFQQRLERHPLSAGATAAIRKRFADSKRLRRKVEVALGERIGRIFSAEHESPDEVPAEHLLTHIW
jgi:molybdenum cofactor cytidylyltransferase